MIIDMVRKISVVFVCIFVVNVLLFSCKKESTTLGNDINTTQYTSNGLFSINDSTQVRFSPGNLQYQASTNTWRFAEHQWDYIGEDNSSISDTYDSWIDLFGWGTGNNPTYHSTDLLDTVYNTFTDWGNNYISNWDGGDCRWYTLRYMDWHYLLYMRETESDVRYVAAIVNNIKGLILLPDDWDTSVYTFVNNGSTFDNNVVSASLWETIERCGAIFMPAAGLRYGTNISWVQESGFYWIRGESSVGYVYYVQCWNGYTAISNHVSPHFGLSVRLVRDAE